MPVQLLRAASRGSRNVGSDTTLAQSRHAAKVSMGRNLPDKNTRPNLEIAAGRSPVYTKGGRPSLEGLNNAPRADIQMNNSGYWASSVQRARNSNSAMDFRSANPNPIGSSSYTNHSFTDYRLKGSSSSSQARMARLRDFNAMF